MKSSNLELKIVSEASDYDGWHKLQYFIEGLKQTRLSKPQIRILREAELYLYQSNYSLPSDEITEEVMIYKLTHPPMVGRLIG